MQERRLIRVLQDLCKRQIEFIVVGGVAAVLNGAPIQTYDLALVYSGEPSNIDRLEEFLAAADAIFRIQPERRLRPNRNHLSGRGHLNLITLYGPLDLLATIGRGMDFAELLPHTTGMELGEEVRVRVLHLETIISVKEQLGTEKDLAVLPILRRTLSEFKKSGE